MEENGFSAPDIIAIERLVTGRAGGLPTYA
jgi:hypothetical protein